MPMVHDGELMDSDTGRAFREDGDGSARTRIWMYRVDCCHFLLRGSPPPMTSIGVYAGIVSGAGDQSGTVVLCSPSCRGCRTNRKAAGDRPVLGRCCVPPHATGAGQTERPWVIGPPPSSLTLWGRILGRAGGIQGFAHRCQRSAQCLRLWGSDWNFL